LVQRVEPIDLDRPPPLAIFLFPDAERRIVRVRRLHAPFLRKATLTPRDPRGAHRYTSHHHGHHQAEHPHTHKRL
ncbi:MAG: hypothetical protein WD101_00740, partial [Gemmatimonadota bacterium]